MAIADLFNDEYLLNLSLIIAGYILCIGNCLPIIPVDIIMISNFLQPSFNAKAFNILLALSYPSFPVQAFALPELTTIAAPPSADRPILF